MSKLTNKIRAGIKKDAEAFYADLCQQVEDRAALKSEITAISELLAQESLLIEDRKKLSRQVGAARKEGSDPSDLIARVSAISAQVKSKGELVDNKIAEIESKLSAVSTDQKTLQWPLHLAPEQKEMSVDGSTLQLNHSDTIDVGEWQSFVDSVAHSTVYHHSAWCELIKSNFGHTPYYITCRKPDALLQLRWPSE